MYYVNLVRDRKDLQITRPILWLTLRCWQFGLSAIDFMVCCWQMESSRHNTELWTRLLFYHIAFRGSENDGAQCKPRLFIKEWFNMIYNRVIRRSSLLKIRGKKTAPKHTETHRKLSAIQKRKRKREREIEDVGKGAGRRGKERKGKGREKKNRKGDYRIYWFDLGSMFPFFFLRN